MDTQMRSICLCMAVFVAATSASWIPDTDDSDRRGSDSTRTNRPERRRPLRLFDEFLQAIAVSGEIPEINEDGSFTAQRGRGRQSEVRSNSTSSADARTSIRDYLRSHRPEREELDETLAAQTNSSDSGSRRSGSRRSSSRRSGVAESSRRHSRRNANFNIRDMEEGLRGIPREHWSCCQLGSLAGDKGFFCNAQFYADRVLDRNANRVHNRRLTGTYFSNGAPTQTGSELLSTFNNCVQTESRATEFQGCCEETLVETEQRDRRWSNFRRQFRSNQ